MKKTLSTGLSVIVGLVLAGVIFFAGFPRSEQLWILGRRRTDSVRSVLFVRIPRTRRIRLGLRASIRRVLQQGPG